MTFLTGRGLGLCTPAAFCIWWRSWTGPVIERRSLKYEAVYLHELTDGFKAERVIGGWIDFYNTERPINFLVGPNSSGKSRFADLASAICARFAPFGGVELEIPPREPIREPPRFE